MASTLSLVKDVRGCMTHFDPLTPGIVAVQSEGDLTYDELKEALSDCGMDIAKVVFDGSRSYQNAFYADFEQGHYCWIPFQKNPKEVISAMDQQFHSPKFGEARRNHDWMTFRNPPILAASIHGRSVQWLLLRVGAGRCAGAFL